MCITQEVDDTQTVCRSIRDRFTPMNEQFKLIYNRIFEFPKSDPESLYWRRYISPDQMHEKGCQWQWDKRKTLPNATYRGIICGNVGAIRAFRTARGHGFSVVHEPSEGIFHVHLFYEVAQGVEFGKSDKNELKFALASILKDFEGHQCK